MEEDTSNPGRGGYGHALDPSGGVGEGQGHRSGGDQEGRGDRGGVGDPLTDAIIGACIEVHRHLGPGLLESAYESCLCHELALRGLGFERQRPVPLRYKGVRLECGYRADVIIERRVLVELKTVEHLRPIHVAQTATYLRLSDLEVALLVNFNVPALRRGLRRIDRKPSPISAPSPISPSKYTPATTQHRPGIQEAIS